MLPVLALQAKQVGEGKLTPEFLHLNYIFVINPNMPNFDGKNEINHQEILSKANSF